VVGTGVTDEIKIKNRELQSYLDVLTQVMHACNTVLSAQARGLRRLDAAILR
jgi:hypothetical protein